MLKHLFKLMLLCISVVVLFTIAPAHAVETFKISSYGQGHQIWFEVEDFDERDPDDETSFALSDEPGAYGRSINSVNGNDGTGMIRYTFDISKAGGLGGTWYFWGRVINPNNNSDFMLVAGHPGDQVPFTLPVSGLVNGQRVFEENAGSPPDEWAWSGDNHDDGHTKTLQDGENTMYILNREAGARWDVFMWTDDPDYEPTDADFENATTPSAGQATSPTPSSGVSDAPYNVIALSWQSGEFAASHDVYLGPVFDDVNDASRTDPRGVLVSQGQTQATYNSDAILDFETTYYWRVDEVNAAPSNAIFKGEVWSFTTEPFTYTIQGVMATTNAISVEGEGPENVVNGSGLNAADEHSTVSDTMWTATADGNEPAYIQFEFDRVYKVHEMIVWNYNFGFEFILGIGLKAITVDYSADGVDWTVFGDIELAQAPGAATYTGSPVSLDGIAAKFIRFTVNSTHGEAEQLGLSEVRFMWIPASPREPKPTDGALAVDTDAALSWRGGRGAASHDVYLGTDPAVLEMVGTTTQTTLDPGSLDYGTTYYWMVVAVNGDETWDSPLWSFSTQAYAVVDDFEAYTDNWEAGEAIFQTWADGFEDPANGSQAGYAVSPFAELTVIRNGTQAMPLFYDNTSASISEATRSLAPAQNWTAKGIKSLSLWFHGAAGNDGLLYVKVNGSKVPYPGDADDLGRATWLPFNVDLGQVAGAQAVSSISIGVEGAAATGVVYIDDVRLYPLTPESITPVEPDASSLLAHYEFEGNANDSSGNGLNGALVDAQVVAGGVQGMAVQIDDGGYVDLGNPPSLDFGTEDWAVSAWYKTAISGTGDANKGCIVGKGGDTGGGHRWCLLMSETTEGIVTLVTDDDSTKYVVDSTSTTNDDEWHSVVGQRAGTSLEIYIDGKLEDTATATENYDLSGTVQHGAYIGVITDHNTSGVSPLYKTYEGLVDDVRIYHQSLTEGEVLWLNGETEPRPKPF